MAAEYYLWVNNEVKGPFAFEQVQAMVGLISGETRVSSELWKTLS